MSPISLDQLFEQFVKERVYLKGVSPKTVIHYGHSWKAFRRAYKGDSISRTELVNFVVYLNESGIKPVSINTYAETG